MKKGNRKYIWYGILMIILIAIDQFTKYQVIQMHDDIVLCNGMLVIQKIINTGVAFSMNAENNNINMIMTIIVFIIMINFIKNQAKYMEIKTEIAITFVFAGGISNMIDRAIRGGVIDFVHIQHLPIFNIADILIVAGWILIIITTLKKMMESPKEKIKEMK